MFWRLKEGWCLRGWQRANSCLVKRPKNEVTDLPAEDFCFLMLCDGETDFSALPAQAADDALVRKWEEEGVIEKSGEAFPIAADQQYRYFDNRFVSNVLWSITGRCNYRCRHCYMDAPDAKCGELPLEQIREIIAQMADCGVLSCSLTGGEALVRGDFWQIVDDLRDHGIRIATLYSNGALVNEALLEGLARRGMRPEISISFDGFGWHDWMRGVPGAEEAAVRALALCRDRGFSTDVQMCIHRGNKDDLRENINRLAELGVKAVKTADVTDTPLWKKNAGDNRLAIRDYYEAMLAYIPAFFEDGMPMNVTLSQVIALRAGSTEYLVVPDNGGGSGNTGRVHLCASARYNVYITPEGRLLPCMPMMSCPQETQFPLIREIGLRYGLSESNYMRWVDSRVEDLLERNKECRTCPFRERCCGGCRANAMSWPGAEALPTESAFYLPDRYQCILFREGYVDRIISITEEAIQNVRR